MHRLSFGCHLLLLATTHLAATIPITPQGPGLNPAHFRVTVYATNLNFPLGMAALPDGSLLVAVSQGSSFGNSTGQLIRLIDANHDGLADGPGAVLFTGLPGGQTALRMCGNLAFVTGQGSGKPISVLRAGATPESPFTLVGKININYPGPWYHPHSALGVRPTPGQPNSCDLLFQLGSDENFAVTTRTATISSAEIPGASGTIQGESIYMLTLTDNVTNVVASNLRQLAKGLRNPAGFAFHPVTGDLYFEDNGIDGLVNPNEAHSADELNFIPADEIGNGFVSDFGFPDNYTAYRTGAVVGGAGVQPLVAFLPLPNPADGSESEGPNDIAFAPPAFSEPCNNGIFVGFHGKWAQAGLANEENPVVFVDLATTNYFHFISNNETGVGHLDGIISTADSLFLADLASTGNPDSAAGTGVIYQIKSLVPRLNYRLVDGKHLELTWPSGILQQSSTLTGEWHDLQTNPGTHTLSLDPNQPALFFRTKTE